MAECASSAGGTDRVSVSGREGVLVHSGYRPPLIMPCGWRCYAESLGVQGLLGRLARWPCRGRHVLKYRAGRSAIRGLLWAVWSGYCDADVGFLVDAPVGPFSTFCGFAALPGLRGFAGPFSHYCEGACVGCWFYCRSLETSACSSSGEADTYVWRVVSISSSFWLKRSGSFCRCHFVGFWLAHAVGEARLQMRLLWNCSKFKRPAEIPAQQLVAHYKWNWRSAQNWCLD